MILTGKQKKFADEYIVCLNATESARRAGYAGDDNSLAAAGSRLLRNVKVIEYVDSQLKAYTMTAAEVLIHLTDVARGDIADVMNGSGGIDPTEARGRGKSHLIKRIKTKTTIISGNKPDDADTEIHETEVEMYDRLKALELLAKYHDLVNRIKVDDWRSEVVALLRDGKITAEQARQELGHELAEELFNTVGLSVVIDGEG